jgi:NADH dehydrogenase
MAEVLEIQADKKQLVTNIGNLRYDYLMLSTGSENNFFGNKQIEAKSVSLKDVTQALDVRSIVLQNFEIASQTTDMYEREAMMNIVIAGGGPTGVELAGALAELKKHVLSKDYPELNFNDMKVVLIEGSERLLGTLSQASSSKAYQFLEKMGITIILNLRIVDYDGDLVKLSDGSSIHSHALVWAAGVKGAIPPGIPKENITRSNRIITNTFNQLEGYKEIFVLGDVAACASEQNQGAYPMVAPVAIQQGRLVADNLLRLKYNKELVPFHYRNKGTMATVGRNKAVVDLPHIKFQGTIAWFVWTFVHLMSIVGFRNKIMVFIDWMWNYFSFDKALRLIIRPYKRD